MRVRRRNDYSREQSLEALTEYFMDFVEPKLAEHFAIQLLPYACVDFDDFEFDPETRRFRFICKEVDFTRF